MIKPKITAHRFVRRSQYLRLLLLMILCAASGVLALPKNVAAACTSADTYGTATTTISVSTASTYRIWSRIMAPDATNNSYALEVDGGPCFILGDAPIAANNWAWVDYQNGTTSSKSDINLTAGSHTLKMIGREAGVKLDRVLLVSDLSCTPTGNGDNCATLSDTVAPQVSLTAPLDNATVAGTVTINATATDNVGVAKVEFYVAGSLKSTDTTSPYSYNWNSTTVANGTYSLMAKAYDAAGNVTSDSSQVMVRNNDTQAPTVPSGLMATAPAYNKVNLSWTASSDNTGVVGYWVARNGVTIAQLGNATTYIDTQVLPDTTYTYKVSAYDAAGNNSPQSAVASVTTPKAPDTQAPTKPSGLVAAAVSSSQINLSWTASSDNVGIASYDIYRSPVSGSAAKIGTVSSTSFGDANLQPSTAYTYFVVARDAADNTSSQSDPASAATLSPSSPIPTGGEIKGTIKNKRSKQPLAGAQIVVKAKKGPRKIYTTDANGAYDVTGLPAGTYTVQYRKAGYRTQTVTLRIKFGKAVTKDINLRAR